MDLATVASVVMRPGAPFVRDERVALSLRLIGSLLDGRALLGEISPDLMRDVRAAGHDTTATLVVPAGPGPARVEVNGRQYPIPAALRDALLAALPATGRDAAAALPAPPATPGTPGAAPAPRDATATLQLPTQALVVPSLQPGAASAASSAATANVLAASGMLRAARNEAAAEPAHPAPFETPVFDPRAPASTAERLAAHVSGSGAFFESHVAQWVRGERTGDAVRAEASDLARIAARDPARAETRGTLQVETLQRHAIALAGPAWSGQPMLLELGRDPHTVYEDEAGGRSATDAVFVARLRLELPQLGSVDVQLRLAGDRIAAFIEGTTEAGVRQLVEALPAFGAALAARGLRPVLLQAVREGTAGAEAAA